MKETKRQMFYLDDDLLYSLWKYLNSARLTGKDSVDFKDISSIKEIDLSFLLSFSGLLNSILDRLNGIVFNESAYFILEDLYEKFGELTKEDIERINDKLRRINKKITNNSIYLPNLRNFFYHNDQELEMLELFKISTLLPQKDREEITDYISSYIQCFVNDDLSEDINFYCFNEQKRIMFEKLSLNNKKYGQKFILEYPDEESEQDKEYLFAHTLITLESLGYLEIEAAWVSDEPPNIKELTKNYKIKLILKKKFFEEKNNFSLDNMTNNTSQVIQERKNDNPSSYIFPTDLKWEEIFIQFLNGHEVIITYRGSTIHTTYEEMGFKDKKNKLPNKQWEFLKGLSENNNEISWNYEKATDKGKKQKQLLAQKLKAFFHIEEDPFLVYRKEKAYRIKIGLSPETEAFRPSDLKFENDELGIKEFLEEQSPEIFGSD